jgi:hypothetical protein
MHAFLNLLRDIACSFDYACLNSFQGEHTEDVGTLSETKRSSERYSVQGMG